MESSAFSKAVLEKMKEGRKKKSVGINPEPASDDSTLSHQRNKDLAKRVEKQLEKDDAIIGKTKEGEPNSGPKEDNPQLPQEENNRKSREEERRRKSNERRRRMSEKRRRRKSGEGPGSKEKKPDGSKRKSKEDKFQGPKDQLSLLDTRRIQSEERRRQRSEERRRRMSEERRRRRSREQQGSKEGAPPLSKEELSRELKERRRRRSIKVPGDKSSDGRNLVGKYPPNSGKVADNDEPKNPERIKQEPIHSFRFDAVVATVGCSILLGCTAVGLECYVFTLDQGWNGFIRGETPINAIPDREVFRGKTYKLDVHEYQRKVKDYSVREDTQEILFIVFLSSMMGVAILHLCTCYMRAPNLEKYSVLLVLLYAIGGALCIYSSTLLISAAVKIENNYKYAAEMLFNFQHMLDDQSPVANEAECTSKSEYKNGCAAYEMAKAQARDLEVVFRLCGDGSRYSRYYKSNKVVQQKVQVGPETYTRKDLKTMGFCSQDGYKFAAALFAILTGVLFSFVPVVYCCERTDPDDDEGKPLPEAPKKKPKKNISKKEVVKNEVSKKEVVKKEVSKKEIVKKEVSKKDDSKKDDTKKEDVKREGDTKKEDVKREDVKNVEVKKEDSKKEDSKKDDTKKEDVKKEAVKNEEVKEKDAKQKSMQKENVKKEDKEMGFTKDVDKTDKEMGSTKDDGKIKRMSLWVAREHADEFDKSVALEEFQGYVGKESDEDAKDVANTPREKFKFSPEESLEKIQ